MQVSDYMSRNPVTVDREETVAAAARILSSQNVGALPVISASGRLVGMLTDRDIAVRCVAANFDPNVTRVRTVMSAAPVTVSASADLASAAGTMAARRVRRLPVTSEGKLVGILSRGDLVGAARESLEAARRRPGEPAQEAEGTAEG